ncbi:hypothetical protein [Sediminibacter sp. Hel_I_10]|uniref:hypothetical protein n=1 Tax=Sediminibacter sp. Hel_I_10 TaxID=1392490 RepID=UPI0018CC072A|nr:hypothetical protein [Sediminibacter sp. Hel_I_10]
MKIPSIKKVVGNTSNLFSFLENVGKWGRVAQAVSFRFAELKTDIDEIMFTKTQSVKTTDSKFKVAFDEVEKNETENLKQDEQVSE